MDEQTELAHLRKAEFDIAKARERIARQEELIERLQAQGHDITAAQSVLHTMRDTLGAMEEHREVILQHLAAAKRPS